MNFRRRDAAPPLRPFVEHYWLIDWDLTEPFEQHVLTHPSIGIVFQDYGTGERFGEVVGIGLGLFSVKLEARGQVSGVQFRPGGFRPFLQTSVSSLTNHRVPVEKVFPVGEITQFFGAEDGRVAALDALLIGLDPQPDPSVTQAMTLVDQIRNDRTIRHVSDFGAQVGLSARQLQRLFADYVGVSPKWVILRYRIHEAIERAGNAAELDWSALAVDLGYSDQAHLIRDFTTTIGLTPTAYVKAMHGASPGYQGKVQAPQP